MTQKTIPRYYGLRIYLSTTMLHLFLIIPFMMFLAVQNVPQLMDNTEFGGRKAHSTADSIQADLPVNADSILSALPAPVLKDSIVRQAVQAGEQFADSVVDTKRGSPIQVSVNEDDEQHKIFKEKGPFSLYFRLLFLMLGISYLAGLIFNIRFKRFFKRKRRGKEIPEKMLAYCRKYLLRTPVANSLILSLPNVVVILYSLFFIIPRGQFEGELEKGLFIQFFYLMVVATLLEFLFVYYWQKHRVHIKYIDHLFSPEELRKQVFRRPGGKIRNRLLIASAMTTLLPLLVVMVYLILSLSSVKDLNLDSLTLEQREILIGNWVNIINPDQVSLSPDKFHWLHYVNAVDTLIMLVGIGTGILVSFLYIVLFIKWTNQDITQPVKELLASIRETRTGEGEHYTTVRTNDEIGELAEGYNEMTHKIHRYVENISKMNRELEEKVRERTEEILEQKEEIEAQKEEIEAQLDLTTRQRDTISSQKDLILDSIRYAERIQSAILPPMAALSENLTDHFILFKPRDIVSGDYYWFTIKGEALLIAVADCTGHGVPGAFLSMMGISSLNEIVNRNSAVSPSEILEYLRAFIIHSLHQTGTRGETQDGIEIALSRIDLEGKSLHYAGANRPLYILRKKREKGNGPDLSDPQAIRLREESDSHMVIQVDGDRMPIGIYEQDPLPFSDRKVSLETGDTLYLFSDGYVDQLGGGSRKTFRSRRFRKLLLEIQEEPMERQKMILTEKLEKWRGKVEQIDDILVIGLRI
ncbi:MAG: SpoIIE family protein phosphatase [Bacteroidales bacterium]